MGLADLHIHTIYNYDGTASVPAVLGRARQIGLDVIAITDHDEIAGALKALELAKTFGVEVIPGTEVTTAEGDLLALNVTEKVERGLPLIETIPRVNGLGGFCIAPHPMAGGLGMNSLSAYSILRALRHPGAVQTGLPSKPIMPPRLTERAIITHAFLRNGSTSRKRQAVTRM